MTDAVIDDYFAFMYEKSRSKNLPPVPRVEVLPAKGLARPDAAPRMLNSHMEVTESPLSDAVLERMFGPRTPVERRVPNP